MIALTAISDTTSTSSVKYTPEKNKVTYIRVVKNGKAKVRIRCTYYHNGRTHGRRIRDGLTGEYTKGLMGTKDEDEWYSVVVQTHRAKGVRESHKVFFASEYEYRRVLI